MARGRAWGRVRDGDLTAGLLIAAAIALGSCGGSRGITISAKGQLVTATDGYRLLTFELEGNERSTPARAMLFYVQGSSCVTVLEQIERLAGASAMGLRVVFVERRGVVGEKRVDLETCRRSSTKSGRVADHLVVLRTFLKEARPGIPVIVLGNSEGGDVAARVAATEPRVTHLALLGTGGGWSQERELRHFVTSPGGYLGLKTVAELEAVLAKIRANPDSLELWAGHPYRRWSSYLWDPPLADLVGLDIPIFLAHGTRDRSVPVDSARAVRDAFAARAKHNLTYREYQGADHGFRASATKVSLLPLIEVDLIGWLADTGIASQREAAALTRRVKRNHPKLFADSGP